MTDKCGLGSSTEITLIEFDEQQKAKIGAALQALAEQIVPTQDGNNYITSATVDITSSSPMDQKMVEKKYAGNQPYEVLSINEDEFPVVAGVSNCIAFIKEESQEFIINTSTDDNNATYYENLTNSNKIPSTNVCSTEDDNTLNFNFDSQDEFEDDDIIDLDTEDEFTNNENDEQKSALIDFNTLIHYICPDCGINCGAYTKWKSHMKNQHFCTTTAWLNIRSITDLTGELCYQCDECYGILSYEQNFKQLRAHRIKHLPHIDYLKCSLCDMRCQKKDSMYVHIKTSHANIAHLYMKKKPSHPTDKYLKIFCPICQESQSNLKLWWRHLTQKHDYVNKIKIHTIQLDKLTYSCKLCARKIHKSSLRYHMIKHEEHKSFQCTMCDKYETSQTAAVLHVHRNHRPNNQEKLLECSHCESPFATISLLWDHNRNFHKHKMTKCRVCNINFTKHYSDLKQVDTQNDYSGNEKDDEFISEVESNTKVDSNTEVESNTDAKSTITDYNKFIQFICPECGVDCESLVGWTSHTEKQHMANTFAWLNFDSITNMDDISYYQCTDCKLIVSQQTQFKQLQAHRITHLPHSNYLRCFFCGMRFKLLSNIHKHIRSVHVVNQISLNPEMKYIKIFCPICKQSQPDSKLWWQHLTKFHDYTNIMKSHSTQLSKSTYTCKLCQKSMVQQCIREHMLTHERNKSFQCSLCEKYFVTKIVAVRHVRDKHNPNNLHKCRFCKATFPEEQNLWIHLRDYHKNRKCTICDEEFFSAYGLFVHMKTSNHSSDLQQVQN